MSFAGRLIHRLAIVAPTSGDPELEADLDDYGDADAISSTTTLVAGLVQPRRSAEVAAVSQAGVEIGDHVIFLLPRDLPPNAYIVDADEVGPLVGGRRFDIVGVRAFDFGRDPHLEVDARLVGGSEPIAFGS